MVMAISTIQFHQKDKKRKMSRHTQAAVSVDTWSNVVRSETMVCVKICVLTSQKSKDNPQKRKGAEKRAKLETL